MLSVFNASLLTDMGKTIVRKHSNTTDAQAAWQELSDHMRTSSKGASEKRRLTPYVTITVLDDSFKGSTEQLYSISMSSSANWMKSQMTVKNSLLQ